MIKNHRFLQALIGVVFLWPMVADALPGTATVHHDMVVRLDTKARILVVKDTIRIRAQGSANLNLAPSFVITSFSIDGRHASASRMGSNLRINLGNSGDHDVIIAYKGTLATLPDSPLGFAPNTPMASPNGSYLPESSGWYPRIDNNNFSYRVSIDVAQPQRAVMPGRLIEEKYLKDIYRAVFASTTPASGMLLLAGPYVIKERVAGKIRLRTYFHPEIASMAKEYLDSTADYIDLYSQKIGEYPYPSFNIVSGPLPLGLGYAGLTYMGVNVLRLPFIRDTSLGHEVLHNWWGNGVYIDYSRGNWGEGLTTFMADYAYALKKSAAAGMNMRLGWLRDYAALPPERDRPVAEFMTKMHDASQVIGYNKVAFIFHMLRHDLGKKVFADAIGQFWRTMKFKTASWDDLRRVFEDVSGRDLNIFFDQWLTRAGAPKLKLDAVKSEPLGNIFKVSFVLSQGKPIYAMKVPVVVKTKNGEKRFDISLNTSQTRQEFYTESRPLMISVDGDFDVFRRLDSTETPPIIRDLTLKSDTVTIILAADGKVKKIAQKLAQRLMDTPPTFADNGAAIVPAPLLVIGLTAEVNKFLKATKLTTEPSILAGRGTARVWAARHGNGWPLLVVAADTGESLAALMRPLPHYGRKSYLLFEANHAIEYGIWPAAGGPLTKKLSTE